MIHLLTDYGLRDIPPKTIAAALNCEGVPGQRGETRFQSAIDGNRARGTGILDNEFSAGRGDQRSAAVSLTIGPLVPERIEGSWSGHRGRRGRGAVTGASNAFGPGGVGPGAWLVLWCRGVGCGSPQPP